MKKKIKISNEENFKNSKKNIVKEFNNDNLEKKNNSKNKNLTKDNNYNNEYNDNFNNEYYSEDIPKKITKKIETQIKKNLENLQATKKKTFIDLEKSKKFLLI